MDCDESIDDDYSDIEYTMMGEESISQKDYQELYPYQVLTTEHILGHMNEEIIKVKNVVQVWNYIYFWKSQVF